MNKQRYTVKNDSCTIAKRSFDDKRTSADKNWWQFDNSDVTHSH
jgi:hypothetical protein